MISFITQRLDILHQAHFVRNETIRYSGSPLAYSISEEKHKKGYYIVELNETGEVAIEKGYFHHVVKCEQ